MAFLEAAGSALRLRIFGVFVSKYFFTVAQLMVALLTPGRNSSVYKLNLLRGM